MRALFVAKGDWGGVGYFVSTALNESGLCESRAVCYTQPGSYTNYPTDIVDPTSYELAALWEWSDVVVLFDDAESIVPITCRPKPTIEAYNGSWYRADPERRNVLAKNRGRKQICITPDLAKYGPSFIGRPMELIGYGFEKHPEFTVIHCPTNRANKGTERIISELGSLSNGIKLSVLEKRPNSEIVELKKKAHVLIDQVLPGNGGNGFGTNSLEAWAVGIPVICDPSKESLDSIVKSIGYVPFVYPSGDETILSLVERLRDDKQFYDEAVAIGRKYLSEFHFGSVVAQKWLSELYKSVLEYDDRSGGKKISVCMIARNEDKRIASAIVSTRGLADEVIVVDTGSTDNTVGLCRSLGCVVIDGVDNMNKSAARNISLDSSSGEWEVVLDADEEIVDPYLLRSQINSAPDNCLSIMITAGSSMGRGSVPTFKFHQNRCWPKGNYRYRWRAHEIPIQNNSAVGVNAKSAVLFAHYPNRSAGHNEWKLQYTLDRLLLDVAESPEAPRPLFYLGRQFLYMKQYDKAVESLKKYLDITESAGAWDRPDACYHLFECFSAIKSLSDNDDERRMSESSAIKYLYLACLERPNNRKWWYELGSFYYSRKRFDIAAGLFKCLLEIPEDKQDGFIFMEACGAGPYDYIARCMWQLKRYDEGFEYARLAVEKNPSDSRLKTNLGFFIRKLEEKWLSGEG